MNKLIGDIARHVARRLLAARVDDHGAGTVAVGSEGGAWRVPVPAVRPGGTAVCVGAGENVTLEVELIRRYGIRVHCLDPTPRAAWHVAALLDAAGRGGIYT